MVGSRSIRVRLGWLWLGAVLGRGAVGADARGENMETSDVSVCGRLCRAGSIHCYSVSHQAVASGMRVQL